MSKKNEEIKTWIIGIGGSEMDDVITYTVKGTEHQVKKHLASLVREDAKESDWFEGGDTRIKDISYRNSCSPDDGFYAVCMFGDHHNDYTAIPLKEPMIL